MEDYIISIITDYSKDYIIEDDKIKFRVNNTKVEIKKTNNCYLLKSGRTFFKIREMDDLYKLMGFLDELFTN